MEKFLVTFEFRYNDAPKYDGERSQYINKTITLGVFDTRDEANICGNKGLEKLESKFKLNPNYNKKRRFNDIGSFGSSTDLISNLGYLQTPFEFYAKITKLTLDDIDQTIVDAIEATNKYRNYAVVES